MNSTQMTTRFSVKSEKEKRAHKLCKILFGCNSPNKNLLKPRGNGHFSSDIVNFNAPLEAHVDKRLKPSNKYLRTNINGFKFKRPDIKGEEVDGTFYDEMMRCVKCNVLKERKHFENMSVSEKNRSNNGLNIHCRNCLEKMHTKLYLVEAICNHRKNPITGRLEFLVKWENCSDLESTWEPRVNLLKLYAFKKYIKSESYLYSRQKNMTTTKHRIHTLFDSDGYAVHHYMPANFITKIVPHKKVRLIAPTIMSENVPIHLVIKQDEDEEMFIKIEEL